MSEIQQSDVLKNLIWFMTGLAILGIVVAFTLYFAGVIPVQVAALHPPVNSICNGCY
jgi:hypothetical protein